MKKALLVGLLLIPLPASAAYAKSPPSLRAVRLTPPVFRGSGFHAHEQVTVSLRLLPASAVHVVTNARGRFRVRLAAVPACGSWTVRALGSRGTKALYRHPACASATTGVEGIVLRGPTTPVCLAGSPCSAPAPDITVQALKQGTIVAQTTTDSNGRFTIPLAVGDYMIKALGRGTEPRAVNVSAAKLVEVGFLIDTGIR